MDELSIDDLLGPEIEPTPKKESKAKAPFGGPKVSKGVMVRFNNQKGHTIIGPGILYWVVRHEGKLHYKEASQVTLLPS